MNIVIIKTGIANTFSVECALQRLGYTATISSDQQQIKDASHIILPGVGNALHAMESLAKSGLDELIPQLVQPVLGICLGMQILCSFSQENNTPCLSIMPQHVQKFIPSAQDKIPHMGWSRIYAQHTDPLFYQMPASFDAYFVHSYYIDAQQNPHMIASTHHIVDFAAAIRKNNFIGVQFHPEKSGTAGARILQNFLRQN
jgi:glutamine amidotransferase